MNDTKLAITIMSTRGQVVIPQNLRKRLKLYPGTELLVTLKNQTTIELKKLKDAKLK